MATDRPFPSSRKPDDVDADPETLQTEIQTVVKRHAHAMSYGELAYYLIMSADAMMAAKGIDRDVQSLDDDEKLVPGATHEVVIDDPADDFDERRIPLWAAYEDTTQGKHGAIDAF